MHSKNKKLENTDEEMPRKRTLEAKWAAELETFFFFKNMFCN